VCGETIGSFGDHDQPLAVMPMQIGDRPLIVTPMQIGDRPLTVMPMQIGIQALLCCSRKRRGRRSSPAMTRPGSRILPQTSSHLAAGFWDQQATENTGANVEALVCPRARR
jgi:hypothetical protein